LLLVFALIAIFAAGVIIPFKFSMQRDQEQEMIHRGVQYSRAIRGYYKKFGRYPGRLEDLDNTSGMRYLRKRYKDPLNKNKDFKLLHYGDPGVTLGGGMSLGGGALAGATSAGALAGMSSSGAAGSAFGGASTFGNSGSGSSGFGNSGFSNSGLGNSGVNSSGVFAQSSGNSSGTSTGNSDSSFGTGSNSQTGSGQGTNGAPGSDSTDSSSQAQGAGQPGGTNPNGQPGGQQNGQQFGGGAIVGVASLDKDSTIREFNHKKKYNEWQFVYDPSNDRGGLINTPNQPALQGFGGAPGLGGQPAGGTNSSPFGQSGQSSPFGQSGQSSPFGGQSSGFGSSSNSGGFSTPAPPPSNPPQQQ
jgi:type II secretory pathway pseudopilin PulG